MVVKLSDDGEAAGEKIAALEGNERMEYEEGDGVTHVYEGYTKFKSASRERGVLTVILRREE